MKTFITTLLSILVFSSISNAQQIWLGKFEAYLTQDGVKRTIYAYAPEDYDSLKTYRILVAYHSYDGSPESLREEFIPFSKNFNCILLCPDEHNFWDEKLLLAGLSAVQATYNVNINETVLTGFGEVGGTFATTLSLFLYNHVRGVIAINPKLISINPTLKTSYPDITYTGIMDTTDVNYSSNLKEISDIRLKGTKTQVIEKNKQINNQYLFSQEFWEDWIVCYNFIFGITDIDESVVKKEILFYPNPVSNFIKINQNCDIVSICDLNGKILKEFHNYEANNLINILDLKEGIYIMKLNYSGVVKTKSFIKN
jgi:hypothetical protein